MRQIPLDIDRTLWAIAESNDPRAVEEFGERYPAYKTEMIARIDLVRSLKSQKPYREAPYLSLPHRRPQPRFGRGFGLAFAGLVMVSVAFALIAKPWQSPSLPVPKEGAVQELVVPVPDKTDANSGPDIVARPSDAKVEPVEPKIKVPEASVGPLEREVSVDHVNVKLSQVVREIGQQARLKIEVAPGLEDQMVSARYVGVSAEAALADLGQNFGFSVLRQEGNHVLIVPAIDTSRPPVLLPDGSYSEPSDGFDRGHRRVQLPDTGKRQ